MKHTWQLFLGEKKKKILEKEENLTRKKINQQFFRIPCFEDGGSSTVGFIGANRLSWVFSQKPDLLSLAYLTILMS